MEKVRFYVTEQLSENMAETPEGFLVCYNVPITRTGVFTYKSSEVPIETDSGIVNVQRDADEVFSDRAIRSFEGKPFTVDHPDDMVTPENWSNYAHGVIQNVRRGGEGQEDVLLADILVTTEKAISLIRAGLRDISCGYDADYEQIGNGLGRQSNIIGNHVALVSKGRAGNKCAIKDSKEIFTQYEEGEMRIREKLKKIRAVLDSAEEGLGKEDETKDALPFKMKKVKDVWDKWMKDVEGGKLDISKIPLQLKEVKDEGEEEEDKEKLSKAYDQAVTALESVGDLRQEIQNLAREMKEIREVVEELLEIEEEYGYNEDQDIEGKKKEKEENPEGSEGLGEEDEAPDLENKEDLEEEDEGKNISKDSVEGWSDIKYRASILAPRMAIKKPTKDYVKGIRKIKENSLEEACKDKEVEKAIRVLVGDKDIRDSSRANLDAAFIMASEMISRKNDDKLQVGSLPRGMGLGVAESIREINKKNKEFYK